MNPIYEIPILLRITIKVMPKTSIHKNIYDISKANKFFALKFLRKQRENILCSDTLKTFFATVPVVIFFLQKLSFNAPKNYLPTSQMTIFWRGINIHNHI
jgi:hypothetical protein